MANKSLRLDNVITIKLLFYQIVGFVSAQLCVKKTSTNYLPQESHKHTHKHYISISEIVVVMID